MKEGHQFPRDQIKRGKIDARPSRAPPSLLILYQSIHHSLPCLMRGNRGEPRLRSNYLTEKQMQHVRNSILSDLIMFTKLLPRTKWPVINVRCIVTISRATLKDPFVSFRKTSATSDIVDINFHSVNYLFPLSPSPMDS